jgi:hypothetical protein
MPTRRPSSPVAMAFLAAAAALVVAGCTAATQLLPVNGNRHIIVRCVGATMSGCVTRAEQECGGDYDILETGKGFRT